MIRKFIFVIVASLFSLGVGGLSPAFASSYMIFDTTNTSTGSPTEMYWDLNDPTGTEYLSLPLIPNKNVNVTELRFFMISGSRNTVSAKVSTTQYDADTFATLSEFLYTDRTCPFSHAADSVCRLVKYQPSTTLDLKANTTYWLIIKATAATQIGAHASNPATVTSATSGLDISYTFSASKDIRYVNPAGTATTTSSLTDGYPWLEMFGSSTSANNGGGSDGDSGSSSSSSTIDTAKSGAKKTVYFASESAVLTPAAKKTLKALAKKYKTGVTIDVSGYVQNAGASSNNKSLSIARAKAVAKYLKSKGVKVTVTTKGMGLPSRNAKLAKARRATVTIKPTS